MELVIALLILIPSMAAYYTIITKAGFPGWHFGALVGGAIGGVVLDLILRVPIFSAIVGIASLIYFFYFAFSDWPALSRRTSYYSSSNSSSNSVYSQAAQETVPRNTTGSWVCSSCSTENLKSAFSCKGCGKDK